ncbi:MAG: hypothetical protein AAF490_03600 [Chloroflexota bacterium]
MTELIGLIVGLVLTLFIFSYLIGDNPLYKFAVHILVGVSAAYSGLVIFQQVLVPIFREIQSDSGDLNGLVWYVPLFFSFLLLFQVLPQIAWLSKITVALMIGIGSAVALIGAIRGTLWPQIVISDYETEIFVGQSIVAALLTAVTLLSFQFTQRQSKNEATPATPSVARRLTSQAGNLILTITFGYLFAATLNTSLLIFSERVGFIISSLGQLIGGGS